MKYDNPINVWKRILDFNICLVLVCWSLTAFSTSSYPLYIQHDLFGLSKGASIEQVTQQWGGLPSPFKQPHHYLLRSPPAPSEAFPMIVVTVTEETGICTIGGIFAGLNGDETTVKAMIDLVMKFSSQYGPPTTSEEGKIVWDKLPPNTQGIASIGILTDQLPENITLISLVYYLDNYEECQKIEDRAPFIGKITQ